MSFSHSTESAARQRPKVSKRQRTFLWISTIVALFLFVAPSAFVFKYTVVDGPAEKTIAKRFFEPDARDMSAEARSRVSNSSPENVELQSQVLAKSNDPGLRRAAVTALAVMAARSSITHPMEAMSAKMTLAHTAANDSDPAVKQAASDALTALARHGAVLKR